MLGTHIFAKVQSGSDSDGRVRQRTDTQSFEFVNATEPSPIANKSRKIVRSQAVWNSKRQEKGQTQQHGDGRGHHIPCRLSGTSPTQVHRFRIGSDGRMRATPKAHRHPKENPGERPGQLKPLRFSTAPLANPSVVAVPQDMRHNLRHPQVIENIVHLSNKGSIPMAIHSRSPKASRNSEEMEKEVLNLRDSVDVASTVHVNMPTSLVASYLDPFNTLPLASSSDIQLFIHHYCK
jgi:hypothetical protein